MTEQTNLVPKRRFIEFQNTHAWEQHKLGEITESFSGGTPSANNRDYYKGSIPFIRSGEINSNTTDLFINEEALNNSSAKLVTEGDILYALYGATSGEVGISQINGAINQAVLAIKPKFGNDSYFITQWLKKQKQAIISTYLQGGQGNLSGNIVKNLMIDLPTNMVEQTKIGSFFKQLDKTIALHKRKLEKTKALKSAYLSEMFPAEGEHEPKRRFAEFAQDWEQRKLNTVFKDFIVPMRDKPKEFSGTVPWTRIEDIEGRFINGTTSGQYVSEETIKSMNLKVIPKGSLIVSASATFGVVAIVNNDLITNQTFIGLVPNTNYNIDFLYAFFKSRNIQKKMKRESAGSTIFYISLKQFENMIGEFPILEEQEKIGEFFKQLDDTITLHQRKLKKLQNIKKAYLNEMFV